MNNLPGNMKGTMRDSAAMIRTTLVCLLATLLLSVPALAKTYELTETLVQSEELTLEVAPRTVLIRKEMILVHGRDRQNTDHLLWVGSKDFSVVSSQPLPITAQEVMLTADQRHILVVGLQKVDNAAQTVLMILTADLQVISITATKRELVSPASFVTIDDRIILYDLASQIEDPANRERSVALLIDFTDRDSPSLRENIRVPINRLGVTDFWLLEDQKTVMLNAAYTPSLGAFEVETGNPIDNISYSYGKSSTQPILPFAIFSQADKPICRMYSSEGNWASDFVMVSNGTRELVLSGFNPKFRTVEVYSRVPLRVSTATADDMRFISGTDIYHPLSLVAGSCDLSVIWAADTLSNRFTQHARNSESDLLETVGTIILGYAPTAIAVSDAGDFGVAASNKRRKLTLFRSDMQETRGIVGDEDVRELQRLLSERGFLTGTIDGIYGAKTERAVQIFQKQNSVDLEIKNSIPDSLEIIKSVPAY